MEGKSLKQKIKLALDTLAMRGRVQRREVAVAALREARDSDWSLLDLYEAKLQYVQSQVTTEMNLPMNERDAERIFERLPDEFRAVFDQIPKFICVSPRAGRGSEHQMSYRATVEDWQSNLQLKSRIQERVGLSVEEVRAILDLLKSSGANSIEELLSRERVDA